MRPISKKLRNLCLHFTRQDRQEGKKQKENCATKVTYIPKTKRRKYVVNKTVVIKCFLAIGSYVVLCPTSKENLEWYLLEVLPYNHCLYDNLNRFHFIVPLDIDEIIFPIMVVHMLLGYIFFNGLI